MPNRTHFLYENLIFKVVRLWEHGHFVDILGKGHLKHGKVIFVLFILFFSFCTKYKKNYAGSEKRKKLIE
jgi:hypothetical protein